MKKDTVYFSIKTKMKTMLKYDDMMEIIQRRVDSANKVWMETYFLFNHHVLKLLSNGKNLDFNHTTIERMMKLVCGLQSSISIKDESCQNIFNKKLSNFISKDVNGNISVNHIDIVNFVKTIPKKQKDNKCLNDEYFEILDTYEKIYKPLGRNKLTESYKSESLCYPFAYLSTQIITNIKNHCNLNFHRFQKKYLKLVISEKFSYMKLNKSILNSILNCIQYHINNKHNKLTIKSKNIRKMSNLKDIVIIMQSIIIKEKNRMPDDILDNISESNLKNNFTSVLKYYYDIIDILEKNERKSFSLLPQLTFGYTYIKFDSRFLSTVYDEWIQNKIDEVSNLSDKMVTEKFKSKKAKKSDKKTYVKEIENHCINTIKNKYNINFDLKIVRIKAFEKLYKHFYARILNLDKLKMDGNLISFMTNGYSMCLLFERKKEITDKESKSSNKEIHLDDFFGTKKFKKGLFDADKISASDDFLNNFHKIGIDPNNKIMCYCYSETGKPIKISKGYYNEISHITKNNRKMKRYIKESNMNDIYMKLKDTGYKKTVQIEKYNKYITTVRENWDKIWKFYGQNKLLQLELDTHINKMKAIHKIVRKLVPKNNKIKFNVYENEYVGEVDNKVLEKPTLVAFGKGNGNITISNLKNSGPKGPIKKIACELSRLCIVILTDEFRTSLICSECKTTEVEHPQMERIKTKRVKVDGKKKKIREVKSVSCHGLCHCKNDIHLKDDSSVHKVWNRDYNASKNILSVMKMKLLKKDLGVFNRKKADKEYKKDCDKDPNTFWSYDQNCTEKGT